MKYLIEEQTLKDITNSVRAKKQATNPIKVSDLKSEIDSIKYIDTSDATAMADNLFLGKTAYVKENKITGNFDYDTLSEQALEIYGKEVPANKWVQMENLPVSIQLAVVLAKGNDIYIFGCGTSSTYAYKYDSDTEIYTRLQDTPVKINRACAVLETDDTIIITGGDTYQNRLYRYTISTNSYTRLSDLPYNFYAGACGIYEGHLFILGGDRGSTNCYDINLSTGSYVKKTNIPFGFYGGAGVNIGEEIFFGSVYGNTTGYFYKYNMRTDQYTRLTNIPYSTSGFVSFCGDEENIYVFGGNSSSIRKMFHKYNIATNTFTRMPDNIIEITSATGSLTALTESRKIITYKWETTQSSMFLLEATIPKLEETLDLISNEKSTMLIPSNIKKDTSIMGIKGTYTSDATATAEDIMKDQTAYVKGQKIIGTYIPVMTLDEYNVDLSLAKEILGARYQKLEYIESTGTQYINTKMRLNTNSKLIIEFEKVGTTIDYERLFGIRNINGMVTDICRNGTSNSFWYRIVQNEKTQINIEPNNKYNLELTNSYAKLNNTYYNFTSTTYTTDNDLELLHCYDRYGIFRIYGFKIFDNNNLVMNLIPVRRSDGVICMFDEVSMKFFTNDGTGEFIAGGVINE